MELKTIICLLCMHFITSNVRASPATTIESLVVSSTEPSSTTNVQDVSVSIKDKEEEVQPLLQIYSMKVDTNVTNRFATTLITSKVKNFDKKAQEATFSVVLPETGYITGFVMIIDGKSYTAYVKEKAEAKNIYDQAVSSGLNAAHVATARDSNRFTVSVNVEPQSKATFKLTYEELLQRQNEQYEIVLNIHPGQLIKDLGVEVHINESLPLKFVRTPSLRSGNEISKNKAELDPQAEITTVNTTSSIVTFRPDLERQKQLTENLGGKEENGLAGQFVVQYDVEREAEGGEILVNDGYFVHFFAPSNLKPLAKQVVFILDTSGSMDGRRIQQLKEAMNSILTELKPEDLVNIVEFSSTVKVWNIEKIEAAFENRIEQWAYRHGPATDTKNISTTDLPLAYESSESNIENAKKVVQKLEAYGGTDILSALEIGLKLVQKQREQKPSKHQAMIVFLTDGEPTVGESNTENIIKALQEKQAHPKIPIFSLSFGDGADKKFLEKISLKNLGFARHIYEAADSSLQLQEFYKQISSPLLTNVHFKYAEGLDGNNKIDRITKSVFPIYFQGGELVVTGYIEHPDDLAFSSVKIEGDSVDGLLELVPKIQHPIGNLERLWAYLTIKQVLEARDAADNKTMFTQKALDLALKYSFVTPVSSLVVVKPNATNEQNTEEASKKNNINGAFLINKSWAARPLNFGAAPGYSTQYSLAAPSAQFASVYQLRAPMRSKFQVVDTADIAFRHRPDSPLQAQDEFAFDSAIILTTYRPLTTNITPNPINNLNISLTLPWLANILSENNTLTLPQGNYTLANPSDLNAANATPLPCPKTPAANGNAGTCVHLVQCAQVFPLLTNETVYSQFFCPIDTFAGVCCPISLEP